MIPKGVLVVVLSLATIAPLAANGTSPDRDAARRGTVLVACANDFLTQVSFKKKPKKCRLLRQGGRSESEVQDTGSLKWKHWGRPHARAKGNGFVNMLGATPIKVQLSKIRNRCGHRVYTKAKVRYLELDSGGSFRLDACRR